MIDVLSSTKFVVDGSTEVEIVESVIEELTSDINKSDLETTEISLNKYDWSLKTLLEIIFVFNCLNFCYWARKDEDKWTIATEKEQLDGAIAMFRCIEEEVKRNSDFLSGDELADLSRIKLKRIFNGNVQIPLFEERLKILNDVGKVIEKKFKNSISHMLKQSDNDAVKLVEVVVSSFPNYNDISLFKDRSISFYKRAQLNSKMISDTLQKYDEKPLKNLDNLTAFADYKIPQKLRSLGVLRYSKKLAVKVDDYKLIKAHSKEEVEIRANMIWAVEKIREKLARRFPFVTASHIDNMLWNMSQTKKKGEKPYHRTLTIAY